MPDRNRPAGTLRPCTFKLHWAPYAEGSCLIATGSTRVLCAASVAEAVPRWREESGAGWVTAEYAMLPRSTHTRTGRERNGAGGRTREIERLIGRSLRGAVDLELLGPRTITLDCDVLQADGGTRTASITGAWVALALAVRRLREEGRVQGDPLLGSVAAVSVGRVDREARLDLDYREDFAAQVDMNVVGTADGRLVEVQGTAEGEPFSRDELDELLDLGLAGIAELSRKQAEALDGSD